MATHFDAARPRSLPSVRDERKSEVESAAEIKEMFRVGACPCLIRTKVCRVLVIGVLGHCRLRVLGDIRIVGHGIRRAFPMPNVEIGRMKRILDRTPLPFGRFGAAPLWPLFKNVGRHQRKRRNTASETIHFTRNARYPLGKKCKWSAHGQ